MTFKQARKELEKLGFVFHNYRWGKMSAEPYTNNLIKNNHWTPMYRDVYIADNYITSHIRGSFRKYKARKYNEHLTDFANIFASGKDLKEMVDNFVNNFKNKKYNV